MSRGPIPTIQCDGDDGFCGAWDADHYAMGASSIGGVGLSTTRRALGWISTDTEDLCPEHAAEKGGGT